jgi:peptide/nickel transport system permease protein
MATASVERAAVRVGGARPAADLLRALRRNRLAVSGACLLGIVVACALFAPWLAPQDPNLVHPEIRLQPPGPAHWLGTDGFGRDMYSRVIYGSRVSLLVGVLVVCFTTAAGVVFGMTAGYFRAWDGAIMRVMDALLAVPPVLLAIAIVASLGPRISNVVVSLTVAYTPQVARVLRSQVLVLREATFTEAARSEGAHDVLIAFRHVLPNTLSPMIVQASAILAYAVLTEAALSFLGVGAPPYIPSWGNELNDGRPFMVQAPWITVFPGLAIMVCVLGLNLFGDGLRDVLDPRLRGR